MLAQVQLCSVRGVVFISLLCVSVMVGCGPSLHQAVRASNTRQVQALLAKGADPNTVKDGQTPLLHAAAAGHTDLVQTLLDNGADINTPGRDGQSPLHVAIESGQENLIPLLLDRGADIQAKTHAGNMPLHAAVQQGKLDIIELLLERGAPVNTTNAEGWNPLLLAAAQEDADAAWLLLEHQATIAGLSTSKEGQLATAIAYRFAARFDEEQGDHSRSLTHYRTAAGHFDHAAEQYDTAIEKLKSERWKDTLKTVGKVAAVIALQALAQTAANYQANLQAKQIAQIGALKHANKTGSGYAGYFNAMRKYKSAYSSTYGTTPSLFTPTLVPGKGQTSNAQLRETYTRLAKKSRAGAKACRQAVGCYEDGLHGSQLNACLQAAGAGY